MDSGSCLLNWVEYAKWSSGGSGDGVELREEVGDVDEVELGKRREYDNFFPDVDMTRARFPGDRDA